MKLESKTTKNGRKVYYQIDESGKKKQISGERAFAIEIVNKTRSEIKLLPTPKTAAAKAELETPKIINLPANSQINFCAENGGLNLENAALYNAIKRINAATHSDIQLLPAPRKAETAKAQRKSRKTKNDADQKAKWLENAKVDGNGKFQIYLLHEGDGPMAYVINNKGKKTRIQSKLAYQLIKDELAVKLANNKTA